MNKPVVILFVCVVKIKVEIDNCECWILLAMRYDFLDDRGAVPRINKK